MDNGATEWWGDEREEELTSSGGVSMRRGSAVAKDDGSGRVPATKGKGEDWLGDFDRGEGAWRCCSTEEAA
jgi:hypothetical protein